MSETVEGKRRKSIVDHPDLPQMTMALATEESRAKARAVRPDWSAIDDASYNIMIALSGENYVIGMMALMKVVATNFAVASDDPSEALRCAEEWCKELLEDVPARADFIHRARAHRAAAGHT
jgi:hypothetical protein